MLASYEDMAASLSPRATNAPTVEKTAVLHRASCPPDRQLLGGASSASVEVAFAAADEPA